MRRNVILLTLPLVLGVLVAGCATDRLGSKMASWQGSHIDGVVSQWGPADRCVEKSGQTVCSWTDSSIVVNNASSSFPLGSMSRPSCTRMLAMDDAGLITGWQWRGDGCDLSGQHVMANTESPRPSAVAADFELGQEPASATARK